MKSQSKIQIIFIASCITVIIGLISLLVLSGENKQVDAPVSTTSSTDSEKQYIDITVKGGYQPRNIQAQANKTTILNFNTNKTNDCSTAMVIPKLGISKNLPSTGKTEVEIPPQQAGTQLTITCTMAMYSSIIRFN